METKSKKTFDQNRVYMALNYTINSSHALEIGYMEQFQLQKTGTDYYNRNILRFTIFQSIDIKKKKNE